MKLKFGSELDRMEWLKCHTTVQIGWARDHDGWELKKKKKKKALESISQVCKRDRVSSLEIEWMELSLDDTYHGWDEKDSDDGFGIGAGGVEEVK